MQISIRGPTNYVSKKSGGSYFITTWINFFNVSSRMKIIRLVSCSWLDCACARGNVSMIRVFLSLFATGVEDALGPQILNLEMHRA